MSEALAAGRRTRRARLVLARLLARLLAVGLVAAGAVACGDDDGDPGGLPAIEGTTAPDAYRIVYSVTTPGGAGEEERVVRRPFDAHIVERNAAGDVTAERWSTLGRVVTRAPGDEAVRIDTAVAPAASDVRPDLFAARLAAAGKLEETTPGEVGGRPCTRAEEAGAVLTAPDAGDDAPGGSLPVLVERCVDRLGLVLEERWTTAGGQRVLTKRAVQLETGDDVPDIVVPDATPRSAEQGNGSVRELDPAAQPPFPEAWSLPEPAGFTFVGRYAVQPARLARSSEALAGDAGVTLVTDVWRRGGDVLLLDQGVSETGATPFDSRSALGPVEVPGVGTAELAVDLRVAEVRLTRPAGGFVRLAGTVAPDELLELAGSLELTPPGP